MLFEIAHREQIEPQSYGAIHLAQNLEGDLQVTSSASRDAGNRLALLGVPIEIGASQPGTLMGPAALRTAGIARLLEQLGFDVEDHGDLSISKVTSDGPPPANAKFYHEVKTWLCMLAERSFALACSGAIPIF